MPEILPDCTPGLYGCAPSPPPVPTVTMPPMPNPRRSWQDELAIIDRTMKAISGVTDPEELVKVYWEGIGDLIPINDYVAMSRRNEPPPYYRLTRSSRFTEHPNPWTQRERLPRLSGGLLGEIVYAN